MQIRFAQKKDREAVLNLLDELINDVSCKSGKPAYTFGREKQEALYVQVIKRDDIKIFLAEENGKIIGMVNLFINPIMRRGCYMGHIEDFVVAESVRGKGIGTKLMTEVKKYCKENDINVIKLTSSMPLTDAHRFYEKNGGKFTEKMFRFEL